MPGSSLTGGTPEMVAKLFLLVALASVFCAGVVTGRGWRQWGDDAELTPGTVGLTALYLLAAIAALVARALA